MALPPQFLDEIRARVSLEDVVGKRVRLQRRGRELIGLCPFHNEKTPSFTVSEAKGFFHCFGCGEHGDVIGFVMRDEGLAFPDAVERLAGLAGLAVPQASPREQAAERERKSLYGVLDAAAAWFEGQLASPAGDAARRYLESRGLGARTIAGFRLGLAPSRRDALCAALRVDGVSDELLLETGLAIRPDDGAIYDRFRGRVIFPIADRRGRIIAFGGRALGDVQPKYLNSPDTPLFHKGTVLYALHLAGPAARKATRVVAVEGYMDVIALHQAGVQEVVAPLGTALTEQQLEAMWRLAEEPILCFDGDAAGARAAARAAERALPLLSAGRGLRFASLPPGQDPDTLVRQSGREVMEAVLESAVPLSAQLWAMATNGRALSEPEARARVNHALMEKVERIPDRDLRYYYVQHFRARLREPFATRGAGQKRAVMAAEVSVKPAQSPGGPSAGLAGRRERTLLETLLGFPELIADYRAGLLDLHIETPGFDALLIALIDWAETQDFSGPTASAGGSESADPTGVARVSALRQWLLERGFENTLGALTRGDGGYLDWAADRSRAALSDARIQLTQAMELQRFSFELSAARGRAQQSLADDMTEASWERLRRAVEEARQIVEIDADIPGYGESPEPRRR